MLEQHNHMGTFNVKSHTVGRKLDMGAFHVKSHTRNQTHSAWILKTKLSKTVSSQTIKVLFMLNDTLFVFIKIRALILKKMSLSNFESSQ